MTAIEYLFIFIMGMVLFEIVLSIKFFHKSRMNKKECITFLILRLAGCILAGASYFN